MNNEISLHRPSLVAKNAELDSLVIIEEYPEKSPKVSSVSQPTVITMPAPPASMSSTSSTSTTSSAPQLISQSESAEESAFDASSTEIAKILSDQNLKNPEIEQKTKAVCDKYRYVRANIAFPNQKTSKGDEEEAYARISVLMGIGKSQQIQSLQLNATCISKFVSVKQLCEAFNNSPASKITLDLTDNNYWDVESGALQILFDSIKEKSSIQCLTLNKINFRGPKRLEALIGLLKDNNSITSLALSSSSTVACIADDGIKALAESLLTNQKLASLNLSYCVINDKTAATFADALKKNKVLKNLILNGSQITQKGIASLKQAQSTNLKIHGLG